MGNTTDYMGAVSNAFPYMVVGNLPNTVCGFGAFPIWEKFQVIIVMEPSLVKGIWCNASQVLTYDKHYASFKCS